MTIKERLSFQEFKNEILKDYKITFLYSQIQVLLSKRFSNKYLINTYNKKINEFSLLSISKFIEKGDIYLSDVFEPFLLNNFIYSDVEYYLDKIYKSLLNSNLEQDKLFVNEKNYYVAESLSTIQNLFGFAFYKKYIEKTSNIVFCSVNAEITEYPEFKNILNTISVLQLPVVVSVFDINKTIKNHNILDVLKTHEASKLKKGLTIYRAKANDYTGLVKIYKEGINKCRDEQKPVFYYISSICDDAVNELRQWIITKKLASENEINDIEYELKNNILLTENTTYKNIFSKFISVKKHLQSVIKNRSCTCSNKSDAKLINLFSDKLYSNEFNSNDLLLNVCRQILVSPCGVCKNDNKDLYYKIKTFLPDKENNEQSDNQHNKQQKNIITLNNKFNIDNKSGIINLTNLELLYIANVYMYLGFYPVIEFEKNKSLFAVTDLLQKFLNLNYGFVLKFCFTNDYNKHLLFDMIKPLLDKDLDIYLSSSVEKTLAIQNIIITKKSKAIIFENKNQTSLNKINQEFGLKKLNSGNNATLLTYSDGVNVVNKILPNLNINNISIDFFELDNIKNEDYTIILDSIKRTKKLIVFDQNDTDYFSSYILNKIRNHLNNNIEIETINISSPDKTGYLLLNKLLEIWL